MWRKAGVLYGGVGSRVGKFRWAEAGRPGPAGCREADHVVT